ncbi:MAG: patatin-like phospholipase family protein [Proteobacteria bacterium]|nr:patatin-like phospholipase family protein [Pseudomonadota bacterium]
MLLCAALCLPLLGCAGVSRRAAPPVVAEATAPVGFPADVRMASLDWRGVDSGAPIAWQQLREASRDGRIHVLALSGGGAGGAFGAGALIGLTRRGDRPRFEIVTGVSTGALLAPFAFLGPSWDAQLQDAFRGTHRAALLRPRTLDLLFRPGVYRGEELARLVDEFVTADLLRAVAKEAATGRLLLVATTDLDKEEPVIWNLGAIAGIGTEAARRLFRDVLVASSSIPGLLPPVVMTVGDGRALYDEMHVDGANSLPFFVLPEAVLLAGAPRDLLTGGEIYVLINGQVTGLPHTTPARTLPIVSRSIAAGMRHFSRSQLALTAEFAAQHGMQLRFATLPIDFPAVKALDFRASNTAPLYDYGFSCAERGLLWTTMDQAQSALAQTLEDLRAQPPSSESTALPSCPRAEETLGVEARLWGPMP